MHAARLPLMAVAVAVAALGYASAAKLRESCTTVNDCSNVAYVNCTQGICTCLPDYMPDFNGTTCHHKTVAFNQTCLNSAECQGVLGPKAACRNNFSNDNTTRCLCMVANHFNRDEYTCKKNLQLNDKCSDGAAGECYLHGNGNNQHVICGSNGSCTCEAGYTADFSTITCRISKLCSTASDCTEFVNAECASGGRCACSAGYAAITEDGDFGERRIYCTKGLRAACGAPTDCLTNAECRDGMCVCRRDFFPSFNGNRCHHKAAAYNASCQQSEECSATLGGLAHCSAHAQTSPAGTTTGRCVCDLGAHYYNYTCYRSLQFGSRCTGVPWGRCYMTGDGAWQHTACAANGTCACAGGYAPATDLTHCSSAARHWLAATSALFALLVQRLL